MTEGEPIISPAVSSFASFDGTMLVVDQAGSRHGWPVVMLHGLRSSAHANWHRTGIADALVAAGFRVFTPDARGHGRSARMKGLPMMDRGSMARDVFALADHFELTSYHLVGYSMGSLVAIGVAATDVRVRSLVLGGLGIGGLAGRLGRRRGGAVRRRAESGLGLSTDESLLDRIAVPTIFIAGTSDRVVGDPTTLAERIPGSRVSRVKGTHLSALANPEFRDVLVAFLVEMTRGDEPPSP